MKQLNFPSDIKTNQDYPSKIRFRIFDGGDLADGDEKFQIVLPVPIALNNGYNVQFDDMETGILSRIGQSTLAETGQSFLTSGGDLTETSLSGVVPSLTNTLEGGAAFLADQVGQFLRGPYGFNVNKAGTLAINRPSNRTFNFRFEFVPRDPNEAETIEKIIQAFKLSMHPVTENSSAGGDSIGGAAGFFYFNPAKFKIDFLFQDADTVNKNLFSTWFCFLTGMEVNYHNAGAPAYMAGGYQANKSISLNFTEISPLNRSNIKKFESSYSDVANELPTYRDVGDIIQQGAINILSLNQSVNVPNLIARPDNEG